MLALRLGKPLLVEGLPGGGKTELAKVIAKGFGSELIRLQCYEGLTAEHALYEWNYSKQLLAVQAEDGTVEETDAASKSVFDEEFLLERVLLRALRAGGDRPAVLLVDEIDRADKEFEALVLEVLSEYQVSIPELGTVVAESPPIVVLTSNRTRGLSDALKRRCLYLHIEPPTAEKEREILQRKVPELDAALVAELCAMTAKIREEPLLKQPGAAETIDWAQAVEALRPAGNDERLSKAEIRQTLGCLLKETEDVDRVDDDFLANLVTIGHEARSGDE